MTKEEKALKELLAIKAQLLSKINQGTYVVHPVDVLEDINKVIKCLAE